MKIILILAALLGAFGVALGAFGAHGLEGKLSDSQLAVWDTAVKYQMIHVLAILIVLFAPVKQINLNAPALFFLIGIFLFSGSLYLLSAKNLLGIEQFAKILGPITPIGGLCFIIGWVLLAIKLFKL